MLFVSSSETIANQAWVVGFQSRNRDAFRFKSLTTNATVSPAILFQSRNRDAFRFKLTLALWRYTVDSVSISESRCFSFQVNYVNPSTRHHLKFQSRNRDAFRFKGDRYFDHNRHTTFQSRNRDAFRFKAYNPFSSSTSFVSISESRCFSFQANTHRRQPCQN